MIHLSDDLLRRRAYVGPTLVVVPLVAAMVWIMWDKVPTLIAFGVPVLLFLGGVLCGALIPITQRSGHRNSQSLRWLIISGGLAAFVFAGTVASDLTIAFVAFSIALPIAGWMSIRGVRELRRRKRAGT